MAAASPDVFHHRVAGAGRAAGVSGGAFRRNGSTPALITRPGGPCPTTRRGRGRLATEPRSSSRRPGQLGDASGFLLEGPRARPPAATRSSSTSALRSPCRSGLIGDAPAKALAEPAQQAPAPAAPGPPAPSAPEANVEEQLHPLATGFVTSILTCAVSDHLDDISLDACEVDADYDDDDDCASLGDSEAAAHVDGGEAVEQPGAVTPSPPALGRLRLGEALPAGLAIWPMEVDPAARRAAAAAVAAKAAAAAAAAAAARAPAGEEHFLAQVSRCPSLIGSLSLSSTNEDPEEDGEGDDDYDDEYEEVLSLLCEEEDFLEEDRAAHAAQYVSAVLGMAQKETGVRLAEESEPLPNEDPAGGMVVEELQMPVSDLAFDLTCRVLDLSLAAVGAVASEQSSTPDAALSEPVVEAAASVDQAVAPWGSTAQKPMSEDLRERLQALYPQAYARTMRPEMADAPKPEEESVALLREAEAPAEDLAAPAPEVAASGPQEESTAAAQAVVAPAAEAAAPAPEVAAPEPREESAAPAQATGAPAPEVAAPAPEAAVHEVEAPVASPPPPTPASKAKRRVVIGAVVRPPAGGFTEDAASTQFGAAPARRSFAAQPGSSSSSGGPSANAVSALAMDLGEAAAGNLRWTSAASPDLQRSPSLGALKVTKKQQAQSFAVPPPTETRWEAAWASRLASESKLPMGGGSVAFNLRMARIAARQGPSWAGAF